MADQGSIDAGPTTTPGSVLCKLVPGLCPSDSAEPSGPSASGSDVSTTLPPPDNDPPSRSSSSTSSTSSTTSSLSTTSSQSVPTRQSNSTPTPTPATPPPPPPPASLTSSNSTGQPDSITTTFLSTSGVDVITITTVVENPAAHLNRANTGGPNQFMSNRAAVIGVFTAVGVTVLVILLALILCIFRRRQARKQRERDHAIAASGARNFLDDEDEPGNEKSLWHGSSGTSLAGAQPVYYKPGALDYQQPYIGAMHPYASAAPATNRVAPPVDVRSTYSGSTQAPSFASRAISPSGPTAPNFPPVTNEEDGVSSFGFTQQHHTPAISPTRPQESSNADIHPYASPRRHTVYELLPEDVLAQQSLQHGHQAGIELVVRNHSPGHLTTATPVMHNSPAVTASDLLAANSRSTSADKEQWYDDETDTDADGHSGRSGLAPLPSFGPPTQQSDGLERNRRHDPRFSGLFGAPSAWAPSNVHDPRNSVDAGTISEEDQERLGRHKRVLTVTNA